jgi:hypothetical protein
MGVWGCEKGRHGERGPARVRCAHIRGLGGAKLLGFANSFCADWDGRDRGVG